MPSAAHEPQLLGRRRALGALLAASPARAQRAVPIPPRPSQLQQQQSAVLPSPLSPDDSERYHRIFAHQARREVHAADQEIAQLGDRRLLGHVLAQRYLAARAQVGYAELAAWMQSY